MQGKLYLSIQFKIGRYQDMAPSWIALHTQTIQSYFTSFIYLNNKVFIKSYFVFPSIWKNDPA